jgi:hypothetical protein
MRVDPKALRLLQFSRITVESSREILQSGGTMTKNPAPANHLRRPARNKAQAPGDLPLSPMQVIRHI